MDSNFEDALANCSREPIHIPGAIQPFGMLFALDDELRIQRCSKNVLSAFAVEPAAMLDRSIEDFIRCDLRPGVKQSDFEPGDPVPASRPGQPQTWDAFLHRHRGSMILELEPSDKASADHAFSYSAWTRSVLETAESSASILEMCQRACLQIRRLTGLDGVMVYKFHEDGHGEVIAEAKDEGWPEYLGLHYPASDIPEQARAIFLDNWVRMIPDRDYTPVPLISRDPSADPLDLGRSLLRSVSPIHIEYLRNMGVRASLTLSLIREGQLWGLIAGHHYRGPKHLSFEKRAAAEMLARLVSSQLAHREELQFAEYRRGAKALTQKLVEQMKASPDLADGLTAEGCNVQQLLQCGGAAVAMAEGDWKTVGETPSRAHLSGLAEWLGATHAEQAVFYSDELSTLYPPAADFKECASGLLALRIPKGAANYLFWFRPEVVRTVSWAGNPQKPVVSDSDVPRLRPRISFEEWQEAVRMRSLPWAKWELEAANALSHAIITIDLQRQFDRELEARAAAEWANEQKEQLLEMVSHDLKNPLHSLMVGMTLVKKTLPPESLDKSSSVLHAMARSAESMSRLISDLLSISKVESGSVVLDLQEHSAASILQDALQLLLPIANDKGVSLEAIEELPADRDVDCDRDRILQVLSNLIGNAIKFTPKGGCVRCRVTRAGREICFSICDTGPGIAKENLGYVFDRFWQARQTQRLGTGLGLSIAKALVSAHGGRIWVESEQGQGSCFYFTVPARRRGHAPE